MKKLIPFLKGYKKEIILAPLFKMLEAIFDLLVPLIVANMIDFGVYHHQKNFLLTRFAILLFLALVGYLSSVVAQYFASRASVGFATKIRQALFDHISKLSYSQLDMLGVNTLITRMTSDIQSMQTGLNFSLRLLLRSPFVVFGSMIMAFTINANAAFIFVITISILALMIVILMKMSIPLLEKVQILMDQLIGLVRENITGMRVIRSFRKERKQWSLFQETTARFTNLSIKVARISSLLNPLTYTTVNVAIIVLLFVCALQVNCGVMLQGEVFALYHYMAQMIVELLKLAQLIIMINKAIVSADRVNDILQVDPEMQYNLLAEGQKYLPAIVFENVSFSYRDSSESAIEDINFSLNDGETLGIVGGIGSGKSTLVQLIPRLYDRTAGKITILGKDIQAFTPMEINQKIAFVPQKSVLFSGTIRDNLKLGNAEASDEALWQALKLAQADTIVEKKEGKLDALVEQGGRNFSGGQKQRLAIARALAKKPSILILDDSASALDFATEARLRVSLSNLEMTRIIVSQRISSIEHADHIMVLEDGRIVGFGKHDELLEKCSVYQEIYISQSRQEPSNSLVEVKL